jgi:hypothetical protein
MENHKDLEEDKESVVTTGRIGHRRRVCFLH